MHHVAADPAHLAHQLGWSPNHVPGVQDLLLAARSIGLRARSSRSTGDRLALVPLPALAFVHDDDGTERVVVLAQCDGQRVLHQDPSGATQRGRPVIEPLDVFPRCNGAARSSSITSRASLAGSLAKFDFSWFIPSIVKYRALLLEVLAISLVLQVIGLVTPMFFQVVMDKVLVISDKTLNVIAVGLICANLFEATLTGLRTYVFSHASSKIDVELGARLFSHLLHLPTAYFQARRVGDSVARIRELENIRSFLTGNAMTLVLDVAFSVVFIAVMLWYSVWLTLIVLASIPVYIVLSLLFTPIIRARLNDKFNRGAENQSFLVETISGIDTVKAMAVEPRWQAKWEKQLAGYVVDSAGDMVTELAAGGADSILSSISWSLGDNVENLTLTGTLGINGWGNALNNVITGNAGDNVIDGGVESTTWLADWATTPMWSKSPATSSRRGSTRASTPCAQSLCATRSAADVENLVLTGTAAVNGTGNTLDNSLVGNAGANLLTGNAGNDRLDGAGGGDILKGGAGNDVYVMARGYGTEIVQENDATVGNTDVLSFMSGISDNQIWFRHVGNDLEVSVIGTDDKAVLQNWYLGNPYHVEQFQTSDGKTLLDSKVQDLVNAMASFAPPGMGQGTLPPSYQSALLPVIAANWGP